MMTERVLHENCIVEEISGSRIKVRYGSSIHNYEWVNQTNHNQYEVDEKGKLVYIFEGSSFYITFIREK